jgi:hypothetical protein
MSIENDTKLDKLYQEYLDFISSPAESRSFLKSKGLDPDVLAQDAIRKIKLLKMRIASKKTESQYQELKINLLQKVKDQVEKVLNDVSFNLENFLKQENINLAYKNFEKLNKHEVRELLERHYLLKFESELKDNSE